MYRLNKMGLKLALSCPPYAKIFPFVPSCNTSFENKLIYTLCKLVRNIQFSHYSSQDYRVHSIISSFYIEVFYSSNFLFCFSYYYLTNKISNSICTSFTLFKVQIGTPIISHFSQPTSPIFYSKFFQKS